MKDVFFTNLCWRNCKSCPPEEFNTDIILTNGTVVLEGAFDGIARWYVDYGSYDVMLLENPENWWWTDIMKSIREEFGGH